MRGQVFEVDDEALAAMDALERVADAGWYTRAPLAVRDLAAPDALPLQAVAYFGDASRLQSDVRHHGPIDEYTAEHQALYRRHL